MELEIDLLIEAGPWAELDVQGLAQAACETVLAELDLPPEPYALSILATDDARIAALNAEFRGRAQPTNVLSWPAVERAAPEPGAWPALPRAESVDAGPPLELGDVALAYETCAREAVQGGKTLPDHLTHLIVHGVMHCLGFDHETEPDAELMEGLERRILARLGVPDPY